MEENRRRRGGELEAGKEKKGILLGWMNLDFISPISGKAAVSAFARLLSL